MNIQLLSLITQSIQLLSLFVLYVYVYVYVYVYLCVYLCVCMYVCVECVCMYFINYFLTKSTLANFFAILT